MEIQPLIVKIVISFTKLEKKRENKNVSLVAIHTT
jgi:hypothetical protein